MTMYIRVGGQEHRIIVALKSRDNWTLAALAGTARVRPEYLPAVLERMKKDCGQKFCDLLAKKLGDSP